MAVHQPSYEPKGPPMLLEKFLRHHKMPATVMVTRGYSSSSEEEDSLSNGEVITLHGTETGKVARAVDHLSCRQTLPVVCTRRYEILPCNSQFDNVIYESVKELAEANPAPKAVRVLESVDTGHDSSTVYLDDILEINEVCQGSTVVVMNQFNEKLTLPFDLLGKFTPQLDAKWYSMKELVECEDLPIRVRLVSADQHHQARGHNMFTVVSVEEEANVLATVNHELIAIPLNIDIDICLLEGEALESTLDENLLTDLSLEPAAPLPDTQSLRESLCSIGTVNSVLEVPTSTQISRTDMMRVRTGTIRHFGSTINLQDVSIQLGVKGNLQDESSADLCEQLLEVYGNLQDKTAECIRLSEEANRWKSRCNRLQNQMTTMQTTIMDMGRRVDFWCGRYELVAPINDDVLQALDDYCKNPTLEMSDEEGSSNRSRSRQKRNDPRRQAKERGQNCLLDPLSMSGLTSKSIPRVTSKTHLLSPDEH